MEIREERKPVGSRVQEPREERMARQTWAVASPRPVNMRAHDVMKALLARQH